LDENTAALWVWLNLGKFDDLRTKVFSTGTKSQSVGVTEIIYFGFVGHHCRDITKSEDRCIFYPYFRSQVPTF